MLRSSSPFLCRVAVFPLHLDPPTLEHREIMKNLLADPLLNLSKVILLPHTHLSVTLAHSLHLSAMAALGFGKLPKVEIDFCSLEDPDPSMPRVSALLRELGHRAVLVHFLPDVNQLHRMKDSARFLGKVPVVSLQPKAYRISTDDRAALPRGHKIRVVQKVSGSHIRRILFEGTENPHQFLHPAVLKYVESHGLYHDFRKRMRHFYGTCYSHRNFIAPGTGTTSGGAVGASIPGTGTVALEGSTPRLELMYDENNTVAAQIYSSLKGFQVRKGEEPDLLVPIGGDGYMMHCIRRHWQRYIPFFGVNAGHVGYLLNGIETLSQLISSPLKLYQLPMLYCRSETVNDDTEKVVVREDMAFNDAWLERATGQTAKINVMVNGVTRLAGIRGDGVLVSTGAGSTAYALALGASPVPVSAPMLQLVGNNCMVPARWKPVHLHQDVEIDLESVDCKKRPCRAFVDSVDLGVVRRLTIRASRVAGVQLAFCQSNDLQAKLYKLQFPAT